MNENEIEERIEMRRAFDTNEISTGIQYVINSTEYSTVQYRTEQNSTVQYSTEQNRTE